MRRVLLILPLALMLSACAGTPGIDGVLADEWPAMAEPTGWIPPAGVCHRTYAAALHRDGFDERSCTDTHQMEIVHLGQFSASVSGDKPPAPGSPDYQKAWADCDAKTTAYLGGPWRERKVWIGVATPSPSSWASGLRWYACEAGSIAAMKGSPQAVKYSLKGAFDAQPSLLFGCLQVDKAGKYESKKCDEPHNTEFVGLVAWDSSYADLNKEIARDDDAASRKCADAVRAFVGAPVSTGTYLWVPAEADWNAGDKTLRCFFWLGETATVSRSLKGAGRSGWPLR